MKGFSMIVLHYMKRMLRDPKEIALLLAIPIGLIILNTLIVGGDFEAETGLYLAGYRILPSFLAPAFLLSFQFFNGFFMFSFLYKDFRSGMRWRLLAAPCPVRAFIFPAFIANWIFSIALGVVYVLVTAVALNVYWGNLFILAAVLVVIALMSTVVACLIFLFTNKFSQANALGYIVSFGLMVLSGFMIPLQMFGDNAVIRFLLNYGTPLSLGQASIISSGALGTIFDGTDLFIGLPGFGTGAAGGMSRALINLGILMAITLVLGLIAVIAARRRKI